MSTQLPVGTRVQMTSAALRQNLQGRLNRCTGVVMKSKFDFARDSITVLRVGCKRAERWHVSMWEKAP